MTELRVHHSPHKLDTHDNPLLPKRTLRRSPMVAPITSVRRVYRLALPRSILPTQLENT